MVMDLGGVWHSVQALAHGSQGPGDEVGGALLAHAKHHGGAHVKGVALPVVVSRAAARYDIPAIKTPPLLGGLCIDLETSWAHDKPASGR